MHTNKRNSVKMEEYKDLYNFFIAGKKQNLMQRTEFFADYVSKTRESGENFYFRKIMSVSDREVDVYDGQTNKVKKMLMFGSNNYLGLANHPHVCDSVIKSIKTYGVGIGGPPLLNGYTELMCELEERLSDLKHAEDTLIYSSGYNTNIGMLTSLCSEKDIVLYDEHSHASFLDGMKLRRVRHVKFGHNNVDQLEAKLQLYKPESIGSTFVGVEGIYSMDGDICPLDEIIHVSQNNNALVIVDDAHGTGILGKNGGGTAEYFGLSRDVDIQMGTFSKTFSVTGGFISASKPLIEYLRYMSRPYMFSASLPPISLSAILAGLDVIQNEPERRERLTMNVNYAVSQLKDFGLVAQPHAGIIALYVPPWMNIRKAARQFHEAGIFVNAVEFPAVPIDKQRFRISFMSTHTQKDLDRLIQSVQEVWSSYEQMEP